MKTQKTPSFILLLHFKFERNSEFKELYMKFINEYRDLGHMHKIDSHDNKQIS